MRGGQKKLKNNALPHNVNAYVHNFSISVNKYAYQIEYKEKGQLKGLSGEIESTDASDAILSLLAQYPRAKGEVKRVY